MDDEAKLTLHGLQQHYVKLKDAEKNRKLFELLDALEFNQVSPILVLFPENGWAKQDKAQLCRLEEILSTSTNFLILFAGGDLREERAALRGPRRAF